MDQKKIGRFISELRKEQGMTQQQLADAIGVSNKTISKWECGKGMPEISSIMPLCRTLQININELISGERLPEDGYSKKAEENMMNLIQETEINKKNRRSSLTIILVTIMAVLLGCWFIVISMGGVSMTLSLIDTATLLPMLAVPLLLLLGTGLGRPFLQAFAIVTARRKEASRAEILQAKSAVKLVSNTLLGIGAFQTCTGFMVIMPSYVNTPLFIESLCNAIPIGLLGLFYGLLGYLLLLPIRMKLEAMAATEAVPNAE